MTTLNLQVGVGTDDAHEDDSGGQFQNDSTIVIANSDAVAATRFNGGFRFQTVTIPKDDTIDSATMDLYGHSTFQDDPNVEIHAEDVDDAADFSTTADVTSRARTTASTTWSETSIGAGAFYTTPDFTAAIQEVVNRASWASGNDMVTLLIGKSDIDGRNYRARSYDSASAEAGKLDIDYTAGGAPATRRYSLTVTGVG